MNGSQRIISIVVALGSLYMTPIFAAGTPPATTQNAPSAVKATSSFFDWFNWFGTSSKTKNIENNSANGSSSAKISESTDPNSSRIALWVQDSESDSGHVLWMSRNACTATPTDNSMFLVTDLWNKNNMGNYESLRETGVFRKDNKNLKAYIPKGSLVTPSRDSTKDYVRVHVISIGELDGDPKKMKKLAKPQEQGFLYRDSLMQLAGYYVTLAPGEYVERAKAQGLDLTNASLRPLMGQLPGREDEYLNVRCKLNDGRYQIFMLFDAYQGEADVDPVLVGVSPAFSRIFETAMAFPDEDVDDSEGEGGDGDGDGSDQATEGKSATASGHKAGDTIGGVPVIDDVPQDVICFDSKVNSVAVRAENKKDKNVPGDVAFKVAVNGTGVKIVQGFSGSKPKLEVGGKLRTYIKVEIIGKKKPNVGLVSEEFVSKRSQCKSLPENADLNDIAGTGKSNPSIGTVKGGPVGTQPNNTANHGNRRGAIVTKPSITDVNLFLFPLLNPAAAGYERNAQGNKRYFGAPRKKGRRTHAGCDLLSPRGKVVRAVSDGEILQPPYVFYKGKGRGIRKSYAIEQKLANGMIARYGEVGYNDEITKGPVKMDQPLGIVTFTRMLHFELYSGKAKAGTPLSIKGNRYQRRSDLLDPTPFLLKWEETTFKDGSGN